MKYTQLTCSNFNVTEDSLQILFENKINVPFKHITNILEPIEFTHVGLIVLLI